MNRSLRHQLVVITGAGRGIGRATATRFAAEGARVVIGDLDDDVAAKAAQQIGRGAVGLTVDVSDRASYAAFIEQAQTLGPVDVLVNNAGIMPLSPLTEESDEATDRILDVNLRGVITGTKLVIPQMIERGHGHVINIASAVGRIAVANGATYSASKFAVVGFSEAMRSELKPHGVDVSCILPTVVATELAAGVSATKGMRAAQPDDVAKAVVGVAHRPQFETWVPRHSKGIFYSSNALPRRLKDTLGHAIGADRALSDVDAEARAEYERRAARP
ncbi:SDR family NAD(P)-dependent oxidoreductase [Aeromicrobium sp. SMF47]|uniref:SDR family NAD(P)-dependent oxidoreductase n=1 Tax=Aeromicrobium yanjiei TaxID=2662028 RepID=A0A5Q2MIR1_9ACTN|nr:MULTISPECIES: SDR family oxidoreductase [Aeromicrobium]MRJ75735.1 SDR family NAD(P)-dependent oxidoreductase [Aeromicrobium yanjiei]MRK00079.1 SDR family NAD(P)-dependent oxidoreductase [Aeromicrobium sp. S22]QGG43014.1 SDR family NAD(P)-dependent oxidoreductase [Aeromicrobium yanjiei]